jgi:hypothetical protein
LLYFNETISYSQFYCACAGFGCLAVSKNSHGFSLILCCRLQKWSKGKETAGNTSLLDLATRDKLQGVYITFIQDENGVPPLLQKLKLATNI